MVPGSGAGATQPESGADSTWSQMTQIPTEEPQREQRQTGSRVTWYRTRIDRDLLNELNQRSDLWGFLQTIGYLGLLTITGATAWYVSIHWSWQVMLPILFVHGTCFAFMVNGFHELCHSSVFRSKWLNVFFLHVFSFLGWFNPVHFWASHSAHHKFALHPPDDQEVLFPTRFTLRDFLKSFINVWRLKGTLQATIRRSRGRVEGTWESALFPPENADGRRRLFRWDRTLLVGHGSIIVAALYFGLWQLLLVFTLAPFYGNWLFFLCNNTQHVGLVDHTSDFRLNTRTIILSPFVRFLYWHMNYHIEHHMYAAVPCYRLGRLHRAIAYDLPPLTVGLVETWRQIIQIMRQQKADDTYQFRPQLPADVPA